jgi:uncharacterized protein
MKKPKIIIVPGNGDSGPNENWFPYVQEKLEKKGFKVISKKMPDAVLARKKFWLPFIKDKLKADKNTIVIGHSSGAVAAMRLLEEQKLLGVVLVGACYTDLGMEEEKISGYYDDPWNWKVIKKNAQWIVQFSSQDDPYIPIKEARFVHQKLACEYHEYIDQGHFSSDVGKTKFPEVVELIVRKTK